MSDLHAAIKARTESVHLQLEETPFFRALKGRTLPVQAFVTQVRSLSIIHGMLERCLERSQEPRVRAFWDPAQAKLPALLHDLNAFHWESRKDIAPAIQAALEFSREILLKSGQMPLALIGFLYVLEGSQNGGLYLRREYMNCFGLMPEQVTYFGFYGEKTGAVWRAFKMKLAAVEGTEEEREAILQAAHAGFHLMGKVIAGLFPFEEHQLRFHVAEVNPEAGNHPVPQDPAEIEASLRSGIAAWEKFPYLSERYGERGQRYTASDSLWLTTLSQYGLERARAQIHWLRKILASRGLPTIILETHLLELARALERYCPERRESYVALEKVAGELGAARHRHLAEERFQEIVHRFELRLRQASGYRVQNSAALIVSAWLDEQEGLAGSLDSVRSWLLDPQRFSAEWVAIMNELLAELTPG